MGILNVTPDSFSDGGKFLAPETAIEQAHHMLAAGADIIDIGGESSRPGAGRVPEAEELDRVLPVIQTLAMENHGLISIDTRKSGVARLALEAGAHIINDVSGGTADPAMLPLLAASGAGYVLMHMQGDPETMQNRPSYADVIIEVKAFFSERIMSARKFGVRDEQIVLDPGIGFGKTLEHNLKLMANMGSMAELGRPLLLGASRKSFIGRIDGSEAHNRLGGSLAAVLAGLLQKVAVFRVHDVTETVQAIDIFTAIQSHSD